MKTVAILTFLCTAMAFGVVWAALGAVLLDGEAFMWGAGTFGGAVITAGWVIKKVT